MDAKRGTLAAWSFPARYIVCLMGERLDLNKDPTPFQPREQDLQYVTPSSHRQILTLIAATGRKTFASRIQDALAISLRVDSAVDKQRIDNKHVMANIVTSTGETETVYVGLAESDTRGSEGLYKALQVATAKCGATWQSIFQRTTSMMAPPKIPASTIPCGHICKRNETSQMTLNQVGFLY